MVNKLDLLLTLRSREIILLVEVRAEVNHLKQITEVKIYCKTRLIN